MTPSKMPIDDFETITKAKKRAAFLNEAFANHPPETRISIVAMPTNIASRSMGTGGGCIFAEFDRDVYPTFDDVIVEVRKTSIAHRKALREK